MHARKGNSPFLHAPPRQTSATSSLWLQSWTPNVPEAHSAIVSLCSELQPILSIQMGSEPCAKLCACVGGGEGVDVKALL